MHKIMDVIAHAFDPEYPGYRPGVVESPHGDGNWDSAKKFAHIALKYQHPDEDVQRAFDGLFMQAHRKAVAVAKVLGVSPEFMPDPRYGALRVLVYPPGSASHTHEDFDLFTIMLWRSHPECFISDWHDMPDAVRTLNAQCHIGQIGEEIGLGTANLHSVVQSAETQYSAVYFAIPDWATKIPTTTGGVTVGDWLVERLARSRSYK